MSPPLQQQEATASAVAAIATTITVPGRGRGRVVPRKRDDDGVALPDAAAAALVPVAAAPPADPAAKRALALGQAPWRARRSLRSGGAVARCASIAGAREALRRGEPVVLVGARLTGRLSLSPSSSPSAVSGGGGGGGGGGSSVSILTSAPGLDRFFEFDEAKNADPSAYYHVRYPETSAATGAGGAASAGSGGGALCGASNKSSVGLREWLARASSWVETRTLCRALLGVWGQQQSLTFRPNAAALRDASRSLRADGGGAASGGGAAAPGRRPRLAPRDLLDWPRVQELLGAMLAEEQGSGEGFQGHARQQKQPPPPPPPQQQQREQWPPPPPPPSAGSLWFEASNPPPGRAALLPMRALPFARVVAQVAGRRRAVLVDPSLTYGDAGGAGGVRPYPFAHPLEGYSGRGWEEGDEDEGGDDEGGGAGGAVGGGGKIAVRGMIAELGPGDALVVPAFWWAHQELLQPGGGGGGLNAALEIRLDGGGGDGDGGGGGGGGGDSGGSGGAARLSSAPLSAGALRAQAARLAEGLLAASLGAPAVARCLAELAATGAAAGPLPSPPPPPPPPPTARAHDRALACGEAFDALVEACLAAPPRPSPSIGPVGRLLEAEARARALCAAMADGGGRLRPSHALDAAAAARRAAALGGGRGGSGGGGGGVGAALALMPRRWLIEEEREAARFPTLFRHRLLGAREDWKRHATELPLLLRAPVDAAAAAAAGAAPRLEAALASPDNAGAALLIVPGSASPL